MCHMLDESSYAANENRADPAKVKRKEGMSDKQFRIAKHHTRYKMEKRNYNNTIKRAIGRFENPNCPCDGPSDGECKAGFEQAYDWDHFVRATKRKCVSNICTSTRCLATAKPLIDAEIAKCRLLCRNCHQTRKQWDTKQPSYSQVGCSSDDV
tara:strand:+ start:14 stop:472 length:459 start_codon:yes stop_codon:yes gene_type:complete